MCSAFHSHFRESAALVVEDRGRPLGLAWVLQPCIKHLLTTLTSTCVQNQCVNFNIAPECK